MGCNKRFVSSYSLLRHLQRDSRKLPRECVEARTFLLGMVQWSPEAAHGRAPCHTPRSEARQKSVAVHHHESSCSEVSNNEEDDERIIVAQAHPFVRPRHRRMTISSTGGSGSVTHLTLPMPMKDLVILSLTEWEALIEERDTAVAKVQRMEAILSQADDISSTT
jgi:hypothetical protein